MTSFMKIVAFWVVTSRSLVDSDGHFTPPYCIHHQGSEKSLLGRVAAYCSTY